MNGDEQVMIMNIINAVRQNCWVVVKTYVRTEPWSPAVAFGQVEGLFMLGKADKACKAGQGRQGRQVSLGLWVLNLWLEILRF